MKLVVDNSDSIPKKEHNPWYGTGKNAEKYAAYMWDSSKKSREFLRAVQENPHTPIIELWNELNKTDDKS